MVDALVNKCNQSIEEYKCLLPSLSVNDLYMQDCMTPLSWAIFKDKENIVRLLLDQNSIDITKRNGGFSKGGWTEQQKQMAHKTPMEVAQHFNKQQMIDLLNQYIQRQQQQQQQQQQKEREVESGQREELCRNEEGERFKEIMGKVAGKNETEVREMMSRGEVPTNLWSAMRTHWQGLQKLTSDLQQERNSTFTQITTVKEQMAELQNKEKELEQRLQEVEQKIKTSTISQQALEIVDVLCKAEQRGEEQLKERMKNTQENTLLGLEDIGFFLNSLGMARSARKLFTLCNQNDPETAEMSLVDAEALLMVNVPLGDKLDIHFGIDMMKHNQYPPYQKHKDKCAVCRSSVEELLEEYDIQFKNEEREKELSSCGIPYLVPSDLTQLLETNSAAKVVKTVRAIRAMRQNHTNHVTE